MVDGVKLALAMDLRLVNMSPQASLPLSRAATWRVACVVRNVVGHVWWVVDGGSWMVGRVWCVEGGDLACGGPWWIMRGGPCFVGGGQS